MSQVDMFGSGDESKTVVVKQGLNIIEDGEFLFYPDYFPAAECARYFQILRRNIDWKQESMQLYGKTIPFPRLTAWYGNKDKAYTFSGITLQPNGWTEELLDIKKSIEPVAAVAFNSVLLNLYRNGNDSISWHTDAEKELGVNPVIGSVNFGETRTFQIRHFKTKEKIDIPLKNGSLIIMRGAMQHYWQHQVPKTAKYVNERINLTFRVLS